MADLPILMSAPMVRATLREIEKPGTGKTQTRRLAKLYPSIDGKRFTVFPPEAIIELEDGEFRRGVCHYSSTGALSGPYNLPFKVGDRLWLREAWQTVASLDKLNATKMAEACAEAGWKKPWAPLFYNADGLRVGSADEWHGEKVGRQRLGRFMPRWASRITLYVSDVRVQQLQSISEADSLAEGICIDESLPEDVHRCWLDLDPSTNGADWITSWDAKDVYRQLWHHLNGPGSWESNPWVVAYTFVPRFWNIDTAPATLKEAA